MKTITSLNPVTLEKIGQVPVFTVFEIQSQMKRARAAQKSWAKLDISKRAKIILKARDVLYEAMDAVAELISRENGKPLVEALAHDVIPVLDLMTYFAKKAEKILKPQKICLGKWHILGRRSVLEYYPYGVVAVIAPWNFPLSIPMGAVVMALMAGNAVLLKPSEHTPFVGEKIREIFEKAGLPDDVLGLITGDGQTGADLIAARPDKVVFTGSVNTGKKIMAACAEHLIPITLELGGKDPMIVFEDADLSVASSAAVWGAFCNSGQICASVERVYVHESIYDLFKDKLIRQTRKIRQGNGLEPNIEMGAMTTRMQLDKVHAQVKDAVQKGAKLLMGGDENHALSGLFYLPTILTHVNHSLQVMKEETFGPVLPVMKFKTEEEVIALANDSDFALNAYVWGKDKKRNQRVASQLVAGTVAINESVFTHAIPQTPWGGPKYSGLGRTHGAVGLLDLVQMRHIHENMCVKKEKYFWWYPYDEQKKMQLKKIARWLFH